MANPILVTGAAGRVGAVRRTVTELLLKQGKAVRAMVRKDYSKALGRTITFQDIPVEPWRDGLLKRGLPAHLVNHLATIADLHRAGRYDRMSDDVLPLTGQAPLSRAGVRQEECSNLHRVGKRCMSVCGYSYSTNLSFHKGA